MVYIYALITSLTKILHMLARTDIVNSLINLFSKS